MIGHSFVINLASRFDRLQHITAELGRVGIPFERFEAITGEVPYKAFNQSQFECLKLASQYEYSTIYEDDTVFVNYGHAANALNELPLDFDLLFLGCNLVGSDIVSFQKPVRYSPNLFRIYDCWQSHSICYSKKSIEFILARFDPLNSPTYDEWLRVNVLKELKCFVIAPQITYQLPGKSDIWGGGHTDYTGCFNQGNKLLL